MAEAQGVIPRAVKRHEQELMNRRILRLPLAWWCWLSLLLLSCCISSGAARSCSLMGKKAPAFHFQGMYQEPYSLETFKGHILVMQFGASW